MKAEIALMPFSPVIQPMKNEPTSMTTEALSPISRRSDPNGSPPSADFGAALRARNSAVRMPCFHHRRDRDQITLEGEAERLHRLGRGNEGDDGDRTVMCRDCCRIDAGQAARQT